MHLVPGALGILTRGTPVAAAWLLLAAVAWKLPRARPAPGGERPRAWAPSGGAVSWLIAGGAAAAMALWLLATAWSHTAVPSEGIDTLTFHLPNLGKWIQSGTVWRVDEFVPLLANGNYPQNGDVVFLAVVLPWHNDAFVALVNPVYAAVSALAVFALGRELGAPRSTALLAGVVFAALPIVGLVTNGQAMTDSMMMAVFGAGLLFLVRHHRTDRASDLALAGLGLGLALGTKWYGTWAVAAVLAVWLAAQLAARRPARVVVRRGAALGVIALLSGGFWLVRNLVESGNPLYPLKVSVLGATLFDAPRDFINECAGYTIASYVGTPHVWGRYILPAYRDTLGLAGLALGVGLLATAGVVIVARIRRRPPIPALVPAGIACALLLTLGYALTPYSAFGPQGHPILTGANTRYLLPALLVAAPLVAWTVGRAGRLRVLVEALALVAVVDGIRREFQVPLHVVAGVAGLLAVIAALGFVVARLGGATAAALAATAGLLVLGYGRQHEYNGGRYKADEPVTAWISTHAPSGHRIALTGSWSINGRSPVWPAFGPRLGNVVTYVGPTVRHQLREYASRAAWSAALRRGRYDLVVVGRGGRGRFCALPGRSLDDDAWARGEGFRPIVRTSRLTLYAVPPT